MKTYRERKSEKELQFVKKIWKFLKIEGAVKQFGQPSVQRAMNKWIKYQAENSKILKEKAKFEARLNEIKKKYSLC